MQALPHFTRRLAWPVLASLAALVACEGATAPDRAGGPAPGVAAAVGNGSTVMVPFDIRMSFGPGANSQPLLCQPAQAGIYIGDDHYAGSGPASHMGRSAGEIVFDSCTLVGSGGIAWITQGHMTFTAADGDALHGAFTITQYVNGDFVLDPVDVTGGTGRFANTTGEVTGAGFVDRTTHLGTFEAHGQITRPNH